MTLQKHLPYLFILLCAGCSSFPQPVGGPCEYDQFIGVARVKQTNGNFRATCSSEALIAEGLNHIELPIQPTWPSARVTYPAVFKKITSGSCTPFFLTLLSTGAEQNRGFFLEFSQDGNILPRSERHVRQLGETIISLQDDALHLQLCGQTSSAGSDEYNLNLSGRYTTLVKGILQEAGVAREQSTTINMGEYGCHGHCSILSDNKNGVCVSFR